MAESQQAAAMAESQQAVEEYAAADNAPISDALLRNSPDPSEKIVWLEYSRHPRGFEKALQTCAELEPCRLELSAHGFSPKHSTGAHIFVRPELFEAVSEAANARASQLHARHVLVAVEFEELLSKAVGKLPSRLQVRVKNRQVTSLSGNAQHEQGEGGEPDEDSLSEVDMVEPQPDKTWPHEDPQTAKQDPHAYQSLEQVPYVVKRTFITVPVKSSIYSGSSSGQKTVSTSDKDPTHRNPRKV
mmetsp:Transcript_115812/g.212869  ORF Transcript_115812/g.212869 Transcript_115812/m.212869 type:complete len:244 (-) Transcript_115812:238-969(-)